MTENVVATELETLEATDLAELAATDAQPDVVEETSAYEVMLLQSDFY